MGDSKPIIKPLQFETYLALIENSVGSYLFKNLFVEIDGVKKDATEDGWLSCAFFASSLLYISKYIDSPHGTVDGTVKDLIKNGWEETSMDSPEVGSVIVWKNAQGDNSHKHIGFYVGNELAISNDSYKKYPIKYDWKFKGKRDIEKVYWNPKIKSV
jgi:hypothetical protein